MSSKFLDKTGLDTLWAKIKSTFQTLGNLVTAWGSTPSDTKYPSEKLVKTSLDAKANDSAVLHKAGLETATGQKWFEGGFCVFNTSNVGYGHYTLPGTGAGTAYNNWPEEYKDGAHFREWRLSFNTGVNFWGKLRITISTSFSSFNASGSMQKTINCAFNTANVFNNTGYYNDLGINSEKEFRISDLIWNNTTACWEIKIHSIKPASNNAVLVLLIEFWTHSTTNRDSALGIHWVSASPDIVTDTTYYTKRTGNASTTPGTGGVQFNWADTPVQQSPYGYEIFNRSHTIPIGNGGTGATTKKAAEYAINGGMAQAIGEPQDAFQFVFSRVGSDQSATNGVFLYRTAATIWSWIKGRISSVLGLTATDYGGNAATATTAAGYTSGGAIDTALQGKVDKKTGMGLSTNDYTTDEKDKLAGIADGAEVNVQSDWNQATTTADDYIKNKPQNLVQDASYVHTDNNYTTDDKAKVASAVQPGDLGTAAYKDVPESGDASTEQVVMGDDSRLSDKRDIRSRMYYSAGSYYGVKFATTKVTAAQSTAYGVFSFTRLQISTGIKTLSASAETPIAGIVQLFHRTNGAGDTLPADVSARITLFQSDYTGQIRIYFQINGNEVDWYIVTNSPQAYVTWSIAQMFQHVRNSTVTATDLSAVSSLSGLTENNASYKTPLVAASNTGTGSQTNPVYVDGNGRLQACTSVNADTVDGFHFSTSTSGSATNTVYLV